MFVIGNLIGAVATVLDILLTTLLVVILINALLSWVRARSGRLADAVLLHAAVNSGGLIAAHVVATLAEGDKTTRPGTGPFPRQELARDPA